MPVQDVVEPAAQTIAVWAPTSYQVEGLSVGEAAELSLRKVGLDPHSRHLLRERVRTHANPESEKFSVQ